MIYFDICWGLCNKSSNEPGYMQLPWGFHLWFLVKSQLIQWATVIYGAGDRLRSELLHYLGRFLFLPGAVRGETRNICCLRYPLVSSWLENPPFSSMIFPSKLNLHWVWGFPASHFWLPEGKFDRYNFPHDPIQGLRFPVVPRGISDTGNPPFWTSRVFLVVWISRMGPDSQNGEYHFISSLQID